jgi:hypothetical protein
MSPLASAYSRTFDHWLTMREEVDRESYDIQLSGPEMDKVDWNRLMEELLSYHDDVERAVNAAAVLTEAADESRLPELERLFSSGDYFLREVLGEPIARIKGLDALPLLLEGLTMGHQEGHDHDTLQSVIADLIEVQQSEAVPSLLKMLRSPSNGERSMRHGSSDSHRSPLRPSLWSRL